MQTMIDPATLRAVEKAAQALCFGENGDRCDRCIDSSHCVIRAMWMTDAIAAIAAFLDEMGQDIAAARVRRCVGQQNGGDA
jgi:DNA-binding IscR family transcriptional regulator